MLRNYWRIESQNKNSYSCGTVGSGLQIQGLVVSKTKDNTYDIFIQFSDHADLYDNSLLKSIIAKFYDKIGGRPAGQGLFKVNTLFNTVELENKDTKLTKAMIEAMDEVMPFGKDVKNGILNLIDPSRLLATNGLLSQAQTETTTKSSEIKLDNPSSGLRPAI